MLTVVVEENHLLLDIGLHLASIFE